MRRHGCPAQRMRPFKMTTKTMPPTGDRSGALAGSTLARNRMITQRKVPSAGILRDQQTLNQRTGTHGHLLLKDCECRRRIRIRHSPEEKVPIHDAASCTSGPYSVSSVLWSIHGLQPRDIKASLADASRSLGHRSLSRRDRPG